ncbi:MAG: NAD(P)H-hydrate dehydratase [bacterium]|nr:NAD(P)H-hydrate dehydratase [bacterium]
MKIPFPDEIKNIDHLALKKYNIPGIILMENAGRASNKIINNYFGDLENKEIIVFAGHGNNGGDGLCLARHFSFISNASLKIFLLSNPAKFKNEAKTNLDILHKSGFDITLLTQKNVSIINKYLQDCDLIIDAIFGIGFKGIMPDLHQKVIESINRSQRTVISLDIPSGVDANTGQIETIAVKAYLTITMDLPKPGLFMPPAIDFTGKLEVIKLGFPPELLNNNKILINLLEKKDIKPLIPSWPASTHKGSRGKVLIIAGSKNYIGAPLLAAQAALKSGAGLVELAVPESLYNSLSKRVTEIILHPMPETKNKSFALSSLGKILKLAETKDAVLLGPGMSQDEETIKLINILTEKIDKPLVIDADGLNALSENISILRKRKYPTLLTPHPGEMGRLSKITSNEVQANRLTISRNFAKKHNIYLVLKGAYSIISLPNGEQFINPTGNPGMAQAGMGDVLAGMVVSFSGQKLSPADALKLACFLHGKTGDLLAEKKGITGFTAKDLPENFYKAMRLIIT